MRCLYCKKRISLLRKFSDGDFCSDEHRLLFLSEQEKMALARLVEAQQRFTQEALGVVRKANALQSGGRNEEIAPEAGFMPAGLWVLGGEQRIVPAPNVFQSPSAAYLPRIDYRAGTAAWKPSQPYRPTIAVAPLGECPIAGSSGRLRFASRGPKLSSRSVRFANPQPCQALPVQPVNMELKLVSQLETMIEPGFPSALSLNYELRVLLALAPRFALRLCPPVVDQHRRAQFPASEVPFGTALLLQARGRTLALDPGKFVDPALMLEVIESSPLAALTIIGLIVPARGTAALVASAAPAAWIFAAATPSSGLRAVSWLEPEAAGRCDGEVSLPPLDAVFPFRSFVQAAWTASPFAPRCLVDCAAALSPGPAERIPASPQDQPAQMFWTGLPLDGSMEGIQPRSSYRATGAALPDAGPELVAAAAGLRIVSLPPHAPELNSIPSFTGFEAAMPATVDGELKAAIGTQEDPAQLDLTPRALEYTASPRRGLEAIPAVEPAPLQSVPGPAVQGAVPEVRERLMSLLVSFAAQGSVAVPLRRGVCHQWPNGDLAAPRYRGDLTTPPEFTGVPDWFDTDDRGLAPLQHLLRFVPSRTGWVAMAIPVTLALLFLSSRSGGSRQEVTAVDPPAAATEAAPRSGRMSLLRASLNAVKRNISERAGLELLEDFRSGLSQWQGNGDWAATWSYDQSGFARAGALAIYSPTVGLSDYHFEFLGQIENKSMGWVFRAADTGNYYATKIVLTRVGRLPSAALVHYAVIDGKEGPHTQTPLPFQAQNDTLYRVKVDVVGSSFTTMIQDQVVETWSDNRHKKGGIGFFNSKAERSLLRWVSVSHQYDTLGRLCALLAPYSLQSRNGEWSQ